MKTDSKKILTAFLEVDIRSELQCFANTYHSISLDLRVPSIFIVIKLLVQLRHLHNSVSRQDFHDFVGLTSIQIIINIKYHNCFHKCLSWGNVLLMNTFDGSFANVGLYEEIFRIRFSDFSIRTLSSHPTQRSLTQYSPKCSKNHFSGSS
jgi:hypothetical protein